jgi:hypothetical protein
MGPRPAARDPIAAMAEPGIISIGLSASCERRAIFLPLMAESFVPL